MDNASQEIGYLIPHTHWDREWRYPIWKNRMLLLDFMEALLKILDNDHEYQCFLLDGQCVPIEDYLEIVPENRDKVCKYVKEGRIAIGPWYTLPDLYPVNGECIIRNLLKGIRLSNEYGGYQRIGYNSFGWGQISQFPQIYKNFGFDFVIVAKKVSEKRAPDSEFIWESPDGTRILASRLGQFARANFFFHAYIKIRYGIDYLDDAFKYTPARAGLAYHKASERDQDEDYFLIAPKKAYFPEFISEGVEEAWAATEETLVKGHRLFLNGCDFSSPQEDLTKLIADANKILKGKKLVNCKLETYVEKLKANLDVSKLHVIKGELRDGPACDCSANALSSRIYIKQINKQAENVIIFKVEPLASALSMAGICHYPKRMLDIAWKYLLQSHAHDSINGVVQDKTAEDTTHRLNQALEIGNVLYEKLTADVVKNIKLSKYTDDDLLLVVFNPVARAADDEVIKVCIDTPQDKSVWNFGAIDCDGMTVRVQHISRQEKAVPVHDMDSRPWPNYIDRHICYIQPGTIPACGYKVIKIIPQSKFKRNYFYPLEMRRSMGDDISTAPNKMENEFLKVKINDNGTLTINDKINGIKFDQLHYFEDTGDIGNYWSHYPPYSNQTVSSLGMKAKIWCEENGPLSSTFGIEIRMNIPESGSEPLYGIRGESRRSETETIMIITSWITLRRNSKRVEIRTKVKNTAKNHRLRVAFPVGIKAVHGCSSGHFTVEKRSIEPVKDVDGSYYPEMQTLPMQHFVDVSDGKTGLALLNNCLTEYELTNGSEAHLFLTLFRSVGNTIVTGWRCVPWYPKQQGSYMLRELEFEYAIYPHKGDFENGNVYREAEQFNYSLMPIQTSAHNKGHLPEKHSLFSIEPNNLILSAFKKAEDRDSYILRVYNPLDTVITGKINFAVPIKNAYFTNMNEERISSINLHNSNSILLDIEHHKIVTIELLV